MFGTLHWNSSKKEAEFVERLHGSLNLEKNPACDRCRAKKARCNAKDGRCGRCKRLRKTCTFSSSKQRSDQRNRIGSISIVQQEHSVDLSIGSSASPRSNGSAQEQEQSPKKRVLTSSSAIDINSDDRRREQPQLTDYTRSEMFDGLPDDLDLTLFAGDDDRISQDRGDTLNFTHSPWSLSKTLSSLHPEAVNPATIGTFGSLLLPSSSTVDDTTCHLPHSELDSMFLNSDSSTTQFQYPSIFEIHAAATPTYSQTSSTVSSAVHSQSSSGQSCHCLATVIFAVEEFETDSNAGNRADLDSIVSSQKLAINCCHSMLNCGSCIVRRENLILLVFMSERIVRACGQIVVLYLMTDGETRASSVPCGMSSRSPTDHFSHCVNTDDQNASKHTPSSTCNNSCRSPGSLKLMCTETLSGWQKLLLGDYEVNSLVEWEHLVRVLISLQLQALLRLLADLKRRGSEVLGETQMASLAQAERRVGAFEKEIHIIVPKPKVR